MKIHSLAGGAPLQLRKRPDESATPSVKEILDAFEIDRSDLTRAGAWLGASVGAPLGATVSAWGAFGGVWAGAALLGCCGYWLGSSMDLAADRKHWV